MKRTIWALGLCLSIISGFAFADTFGDYRYTDNGDGTCTITGYTGPGGDVTIPDKLNGLRVTVIGNWAFYNEDSLTSVIIPGSVTTIGDGAFAYCDGLTSVTIGNSVTTIGYSAFSFCNGLTSVTIPDSVTTIGYSAFSNCDCLTSVTIPDSVTTIGYSAFRYCDGLVEITVDTANPSYSSLDGVLFNKDQTTLIQFPGGKAGDYSIPDSVTAIGSYAFYNCDGLTSVTIGSSVTTIGYSAFSNCDCMTSVTVPDSVTTIGVVAFAYCDGLVEITVDTANPSYSSLDGVLFNFKNHG